MKILIIGEFSGFSKNLCRGFLNLGHEACVFNWGDGFKKIPTEEGSVTINLDNYRLFGYDIKYSRFIRRFFSYLKLKYLILKKKRQYDCALIINPGFIKYKSKWFNPHPTIEEIKSMLAKEDMIYLSACGGDFIYNSYLPYKRKTRKEFVEQQLKNIDKDKVAFMNLLKSIKGVIPVMIDYAEAYRKFKREYNYTLYKTIPLPYDVKYNANNLKKHEVIKIFHGVSRSQSKGSDYIIEALNIISKQFSDRVSINIVSRLPLKEYLLLMEESDIIIDQCQTYSYGMNAIEALSMGKIVLSGNEPGNAKEFGIDYCPVINIQPSVDQIVSELTKLINDLDKRELLANQSMSYANQVHGCEIIAQKYVNLFMEEIGRS